MPSACDFTLYAATWTDQTFFVPVALVEDAGAADAGSVTGGVARFAGTSGFATTTFSGAATFVLSTGNAGGGTGAG